jgi:hypothetical protein
MLERLTCLSNYDKPGSATASAIFTSIIFYLLRDAYTLAHLTDEIGTALPPYLNDISASLRLNGYSLRACIDEAMRVLPLVSTIHQ